jgi:hypothetical protein
MVRSRRASRTPRDQADEAERRALCGLSPNRPFYMGGIEYFERLGVKAAKELLRRGYATKGERQQPTSPSFGEFVEFLEQHPGGSAHGYVLSPDRDPSGIIITGLEYRLKKQNIDLTADFARRWNDADELHTDAGFCRCWYD